MAQAERKTGPIRYLINHLLVGDVWHERQGEGKSCLIRGLDGEERFESHDGHQQLIYQGRPFASYHVDGSYDNGAVIGEIEVDPDAPDEARWALENAVSLKGGQKVNG